MAKNILVITGSARTEGNSMELAKAFIRGARKSGNAVRRFDAALKIIHPCRDCDKCWTKGRPCIVDDAFNSLAPYLQVSDIIVFASPLYFSDMSAAIRLVIDKLYAYTVPQRKRDLKISESMLMVTAEDNDEDTFKSVIFNYNMLRKYFKWEDRGIITVGGVRKVGDINEKEALKAAYELGKSID